MPAESLTELLSLPDGCRNPHAYQIFGLPGGEQDPTKISQAMQSTIDQLNACKQSTEPELWKKAAKMVKQARGVLTDPQKKSQLDARFGIVDIPAMDTDSNSAGNHAQEIDPLASVLPNSDPLATVLPDANPLATAVEASPPPESPVADSDLAPPAPAATVDVAVPSITVEADQRSFSRSSVRRRRRSPMGMLMFGTFMVCMLGLVGFLTFLLFFSDGQFSTGRLAATTQSPSIPAEPVGNPRTPTPRDPVMGEFSEAFTPGPNAGQPSGLVSDMDNSTSTMNDGEMQRSDSSSMSMGSDPAPASEMAMTTDTTTDTMPETDTSTTAEPQVPDTEPDSPAPTTPASKVTEEMVAAADSEIKRVEQLIQNASWADMLSAAEQLLEMPMNSDQKLRANALHEIADLATYYRGGIDKAVADLNVGNDFAITNDFRVIVVEKGPDLLVVRFNEQNRSFTFDEFPFSLAHKLASFAMPKSPGAAAAKAVYQAIAPKSTSDYVEQSIEWLQAIDPDTEEVDTARVIETLESLVSQ